MEGRRPAGGNGPYRLTEHLARFKGHPPTSVLWSPRFDGLVVMVRVPHASPLDAGWNSPVTRQAHTLKAGGSRPPAATILGDRGAL